MEISSHHAHLVIGAHDKESEAVTAIEKHFKVKRTGNPDFTVRHYVNFSIDDARELKALAETRPVTADGGKFFVLTMSGITVEAQNALLKLLEEPPRYAHFYIIVPSLHILLPTVRSRLTIVDTDRAVSAADLGEARTFLAASPARRLALVKSLIDDISKEKKSKQDAIDFLNGVQAALYADVSLKTSADAEKFQVIETARTYMTDRAPSLKMLLECVALNV